MTEAITFAASFEAPSSRIFRDKRVFREDWLPERILHRAEQVKKIEEMLDDMKVGCTPGNMLVTGAFGSGKTLVCKSLPYVWISGSKGRGFVSVYVNCGEEDTRLKIIRSVLKQLGVDTPESGVPGDYYERRFKEAVSRHKFVTLTLDEINKFTERRGAESFKLFYALSRLVPNVATIMLTNKPTFETDFTRNMDGSVRDTFRWTRIEFPDYDATQLTDIVEDRCRVGFNPETYDRGICGLIAALAYNLGGRARGALALAHRSAEIAEACQHNTILESDVREAADRLKQEQSLEIVRRLPPIERRILGFILVNHPTGQMAYDWFKTIAPEHGAGTSVTSFYDYLNRLETMGLIEKEKYGRGRGKGLEMVLQVPSEIEESVRLSLEPTTPLTATVNVTEPNPL